MDCGIDEKVYANFIKQMGVGSDEADFIPLWEEDSQRRRALCILDG